MNIRFFLLGLLATSTLVFTNTANAKGFYFYPTAGVVFPLNGGDESYQLGLTAGYGWTDNFSTDINASRIFSNGSGIAGNSGSARMIYQFKLPLVKPYISAGGGVWQLTSTVSDEYQGFVTGGAGLELAKILLFSLRVGADVTKVIGGDTFIQPQVAAGIRF